MKPTKLKSKRPHLNEIKFKNRRVLLRLLSSVKSISRYDLAKQSGLTQMAVSRLVKELIQMEICYEDKLCRFESKPGRRRIGLRINPDGGYVVSACLSAFSKLASISDISNQRRITSEIPDNALGNPKDAIDFIISFVEKNFRDNDLDRSRLLGVGIVVAGSINLQKGYLINAPLLNWTNFPIKTYLEESLQCGVVLENIADALCQTCLGVKHTKVLDSENILLVHNAAGMGASLSIGGKIFRQHADESWISKIPLEHDLSYTRQITTLGSVSSGHAVLKKLNIGAGISHQFADCLNFALNETEAGNTTVQDAFYKAGFHLGLALFPLTVAYLPDRIVLAGPTGTNPFFESGVRDGYRRYSETLEIQSAEICTLNTSYIDASQEIALENFFMDSQMLDLN